MFIFVASVIKVGLVTSVKQVKLVVANKKVNKRVSTFFYLIFGHKKYKNNKIINTNN